MDNITQYILNLPFMNFLPGLLNQYCIFIILFIPMVVVYKMITNKFYNIFSKNKIGLLLIFFTSFFTLTTFYINLYLTDYLAVDNLLKFNIFTQVVYFVIMLVILHLISESLKKEKKSMEVELENEQFNKYIESLELINNNMQKFRHDYMNILLTLKGYMEIDDFEGLKIYFKEYIYSTEEKTLRINKLLSNLSNIEIKGIKGLIFTKALQAEKEEILINIEMPDLIEEINISTIDLARILGIFLDNAIEANVNNKLKKEIHIAFFKNTVGSLFIVIENSLEDNAIDIGQIYKENFSTKGENRGKGLSNVRSILEGYPNVKHTTNVTNGLFTQVMIIENDV